MADNTVKNRYAALRESTRVSSALNEDKHKDEYTSKIRSYYDNLQRQKRNEQLKAQGKSDDDIKIIDTLENIRKEKAQKTAAYEQSKPVSGFTTDKAVEVGKVLSGNAPTTSKIFDTTGLKTLEEQQAEKRANDTETADTLKYLFNSNTAVGDKIIENVVEAADKIVPEPVQYAARRGALGTVGSLASMADTVSAVKKGVESAKSGSDFGRGFFDYLKSDNSQQAYVEQQKEKVEANRQDRPNAFTNAIGDLAESFGYMLPSLTASLAAGTAGIPAAASRVISASPLAVGGFSSGTREALKNGATNSEALAYGALSALIESAGENAIGGVLGKGGGLIDTGLKKLGLDLTKNIANPAIKSLVNYGKAALGEGAEEVIQEALSVGARRLTYDENARINAGELAYAGLLGSLMGGIGSLPSGISNTVSGARAVRDFKTIADNINTIAENGGINDAKTLADGMRTAWNGQIQAIEANKTYDGEQKELAAAPYKWMVQELDKLTSTLVSPEFKDAAYSAPATTEAVKGGELTKAEALEKNKNITDEIRNDNTLTTAEKKEYIDPITAESIKINGMDDVLPDSGEFDDMAGIREAMEEIAAEERAEAQAKSEEDKLIEQIAKETNAEIEAARNPEEVPMPSKQPLTESAESGTIEAVEVPEAVQPTENEPVTEVTEVTEASETVKEVVLPEDEFKEVMESMEQTSPETASEVPGSEQNVPEAEQESATEPEADEAIEAVREAVKAQTAEAEVTEAAEPAAEAQTVQETAEEAAAEQPQGTVEAEQETVEESAIKRLKADIAEQEKIIASPFAKQAELDKKRARYNEIMTELNPTNEQSLDGIDEDSTAKEVNSQYSLAHEDLQTDDEYVEELIRNVISPMGIKVVFDKDVSDDASGLYDIVALDNGNVYVSASRNVITGTTTEELRRDVTNFFNDLLDKQSSIDIITTNGETLTITKNETANKARDNYRTVDGKRELMTDTEYSIKARVTAHIDEISEASVQRGTKIDDKNHSFAKDGFTYRRAYFKDFDGKYYEIGLSIGHNGTTATVYNVGKIKESVAPSANILAVVGSQPLSATLKKSNIPAADKAASGSMPDGTSLETIIPQKFNLSSNPDKTIRPLAYYDPETRTIHVVGNPPSLTTLLGHELFHALSKEDQARLVYFFRTNSDTNSAEFKKWQQEVTELYGKKYAESGREFTESDFWREYAAMSCESLFTDKQFIERLCGKSKTLGQRILDWIKNAWYAITGRSRYTTNRAVEAGKLTEKALRKAALLYSDALGVKLNLVERQIVKSSVPEAIASDIGFGDDVGGINYSLEAGADITDTPAENTDNVTMERFDEDFESAKVVPTSDPWYTKGKNALGEMFAKLTRADSLIPEHGAEASYYAPLRRQIIGIRDNFVRSQNSALTDIMGMMTYTDEKGKRKALSKEEANKFTRLVYLNDLAETAKIQRERGEDVRLPKEYSEEDVHRLHDELMSSLTDTERAHINEALDKRTAVWKQLTSNYIKYNRMCGFDVSDRISRQAYYRHQVIDFMVDPQGHEKRYGKAAGMHLNDGRSFLKRRKGSERDINTDFASVEFLSLQQMHFDTEVAKALAKIKTKYDMKPEFVKRAKAENQEAIEKLILREAREAMAADMRSKGQTVKDEDIDSLEPLMTVKNGKMRYVSETYEQIMQYNKGMARSLSQLTQLAIDGELDGYANTVGHRLALEQLKRGMMNESTFDFMSEFVSENDNEAAIAARVFFKNSALKRQFVEDKLSDKFMTWEKIAKNEGYVIFQPREGLYSYNMQALDESAARKLAEEIAATVAKDEAVNLSTEEWNAIISTYAKQIRVMGQPYEQWAVKPLVTQVLNKNAMEAIAGQVNSNSAVNIYLNALRHWKIWVTAGNILRAAKYHIRNFIGDIEAALTADPGVLKMVPKAFGEIHGVIFEHKEPSDTYHEWLELGGDTNLIAIQEMTEAERRKYLPMFAEDLSTPKKVIAAVTKFIGTLAKFGEDVNRTRESLLRYASYLYYKDKLTKSGGKVTDYVASNRNIINGLDTIEEKAYQLSADALGNYADISEFGRQIRRGLIPFYSFTESNMRRYYRFFANPIISIAQGDSKAQNVKNLAKRMATPAVSAIILALINGVLNREADEKLPEDVRNRPHITFGEWGGNVYAFTRIGNIPELLEWVGLDDVSIIDVINGNFEGFTNENAFMAGLNKLYNSVTPVAKLFIELPTGFSFYNGFDEPSIVRDKWEHFFNTFGLSDVYKLVRGKPVKNNNLTDIIQNAVVYKYDALESAYWDTINNVNNWKGSEGTLRKPEPHQLALYYAKQAIRYGEADKAKKYVKEYFKLGGTGSGIVSSISSMNPYWGMTSDESKEKRKDFEDSLSAVDYEKLQSAVYFYQSFLEIPEAYKKKLRKADNATAEALMNTYIDYVIGAQKAAGRK